MSGSGVQTLGATRAEARWMGASLKGRRRACSPFEMLFKKSLLKAAAVDRGKAALPLGFRISDFRKDIAENTVIDLASYRWPSQACITLLAERSLNALMKTRMARLIWLSLVSFCGELV